MNLNAFLAQLRQLLEQEQKHRAAKLRELQQSIAELEAEQRASIGRELRAQRATASLDECARCRVYDDVGVALTPLPSPTDADLFKCRSCGQEYEAPAD